MYGRSGAFEDVIDGIDRVVQRAGKAAHGSPQRFRFPPVFPRDSFERTDYISSFPNLTGAINTFNGNNKDHAALLTERAEGKDWDHFLVSAGTMLVSAACHPAYSMFVGTLPDGGATLDIYGYCFRHEPAVDPARMQAFRMHEFVQIGTPDQAVTHRESWIDRGLTVLTELGLDATPVIANDPFFGRAGRMLAANQRDENLKTELVVRLYGDLDEGTALCPATATVTISVTHSVSIPRMGRRHTARVSVSGWNELRWRCSVRTDSTSITGRDALRSSLSL